MTSEAFEDFDRLDLDLLEAADTRGAMSTLTSPSAGAARP